VAGGHAQKLEAYPNAGVALAGVHATPVRHKRACALLARRGSVVDAWPQCCLLQLRKHRR